MSKPERPFRRWAAVAPAVLYYAGIFGLSSRSHLPDLPAFPLADKVAHLALYAGFGAALAIAARGLWPSRISRLAGFVLIVGVTGGILDEIHQAFVPLRTPDPADVVADALGLALAALIASRILRRRAPAAK